MSARSVPVQTLPIYLRDPAKGEQVAVALDDAAKALLDSIGELHYGPVVEAGVRAQAEVYTSAARDTRRFIGRPRNGGDES